MAFSVRYIVDDVDEAIRFYREKLGFEVDMHPVPGFAALRRDELQLYLNQPGAGSGGIAGGSPEPGGWNRFQLTLDDLDKTIEEFRGSGAKFRGEIADGAGGRQILLEDPSGNLVELFEPTPAG